MTGEELAARRKKAGLTQDQLAAYLGIGRTSVWRLETGKETISRPMRMMSETIDPGNPVFEEWVAKLSAKSKQMVVRRQHKKRYQAAVNL